MPRILHSKPSCHYVTSTGCVCCGAPAASSTRAHVPAPWLPGVLWSISPKLVVFLLSYALLGTSGTAAVFGTPLTRLKQKLLRLEADLRFGLVRLR